MIRRFIRFITTLFFLFILILIAVGVFVYSKKDQFAHDQISERLKELFPEAEIEVGATNVLLPDRFTAARIMIDDPQKIGKITLTDITILYDMNKVLDELKKNNPAGIITHVEGTIDQSLYKKLEVHQAKLNADPASIEPLNVHGSANTAQVKYANFVFSDIHADLTCSNNAVRIDVTHLRFAGGEGFGVVAVDLSDEISVSGSFTVNQLDAIQVMTILNLDKKMHMSGIWNGSFSFAYQDKKVDNLSGTLLAAPPGGELNIKDEQMVKKMIPPGQLGNEQIVNAITNYYYNDGKMSVSLAESKILFNLQLDGRTGKRNIDIYLHDIL